jgi:hypothetical protein
MVHAFSGACGASIAHLALLSMAIKLSVKGLAQFMTAGPAKQRTVLRTQKFPSKQENVAIIVYYGEARRAIEEYHENDNDPAMLVSAVDKISKKEVSASGQTAVRLNHNIRGIQTYLTHFGDRKFTILETPKIKYVRNNVTVSAMPDLFVVENGHRKIIKLDFSEKPPDPRVVVIVLQVMYEAAAAAGLAVKPKDVVYLDVVRNEQHTGAKMKAALKKEVEAACDNIEALWPTIH